MRVPILYAFVFLGALLLFGFEPLIGRLLLPRYGGSFHVWTSALLFFQVALFVGYLYAHRVAPRLGRWHALLLLAPIATLPPSVGAADPSQDVLWVLATHAGLPFTVLGTTAVVAQRWLAQTGREPYALYAISNLGSLGALLAYAFVIEPLVGLQAQRTGWAVGYVLYAALAWFASRGVRREPVAPLAAVPPSRIAYWLLLSAAPSAFLMAVTNLIALDAGSVPVVWVVPLAIYLASFVAAFATPRAGESSRVPIAVRRMWPHLAVVGLFFFSGYAEGSWLFVGVHLIVLAFVCLAAHAELYRLRPPADQLTLFYLVVALGGGIGGAFVALLAPRIFTRLYEYPVALAVLAITVAVARRETLREWLRTRPWLALGASVLLVALIAGKIVHGALLAEASSVDELARTRSFYGLYRIEREVARDRTIRDLVSGSTRHGRQREGDRTPLSYYHPEGPLGDALQLVPSPRSIGAVGLGVGAAAGHVTAGDHIRFFEIDAEVERLARRYFTYLDPSHEVVIGDARLALAAEEGPRYDLLLIDAFSGDAIPVHLLTLEASRAYLRRVAPDGLLLFHVSNRYYDLRPVLVANARALGLAGAYRDRMSGLARDEDPSQYVVLAHDRARLRPLIAERGWRDLRELTAGRVWTDDRASTVEALRF